MGKDDEDSDCDFGPTCTPIKRKCDAIITNAPVQYQSLEERMRFCLTSGYGDNMCL